MAYPSVLIRTKNWGTETLTDTDLEAQLDLIIAWVDAFADETTGHKHDGTTNEGPKISLTGGVSGSLPLANGGTGLTTLTTGDVLYASATDTLSKLAKGTSGQALKMNAGATVPEWGVAVVQMVNTQTGAVATGTTVMPWDDTIPQITEGDEYMTLAITPTNASNKLKIEVVFHFSSNANSEMVCALFQDSTAGALAAVAQGRSGDTAYVPDVMVFTHYMTAGTTSSTTFKVRAGNEASSTTTFNGVAGARKLGGVSASSITITELTP